MNNASDEPLLGFDVTFLSLRSWNKYLQKSPTRRFFVIVQVMQQIQKNIIVHAKARQLEWEGILYNCAIGYGGISESKHEGDGCTPVGKFKLREVLYRADKVTIFNTRLLKVPISPDDGWCDDSSNKKYNQLVKIQEPCTKEYLWRNDSLYDVLVVLGYNDNPAVPYLGSAIFLHVTDNYSSTEGCIALSKNDLVTLLQKIDEDNEIVIKE